MSTYQAKFSGVARLESFRGRLRVRFPRSLFDGCEKTLSLGLPDLPKYRAIAEAKVEAINSDIALDQFDFTLDRYRPQHKQKLHLVKAEEFKPQVSLLELWDKYYEYGLPKWKESTQVYLKTSIRRWLEKAEVQIDSVDKALELRNFLLSHTSESMTKRVLTWVNAAFNWETEVGGG